MAASFFPCNLYSVFYALERVPNRSEQLRGELNSAFGWPAPDGAKQSLELFYFILIPLGLLNLFVMRRVLKEAADGPTIYHYVEIGCDIISGCLFATFGLHWGQIMSPVTKLITGMLMKN